MFVDQDNHDGMDINSTDSDTPESDPESETKIPINSDEESEDERPSLGSTLPSFRGSFEPRDSTQKQNIQQTFPVSFATSNKPAVKQKQFRPAQPAIVDPEFASFEKYSKGIGSKLLMKMGYVPGQGLGQDGKGINKPIDIKLRPTKMGLGHGGFDERTETVKQELREKGIISDDEGALKPIQHRGRWKKHVKKRPLYKTSLEILTAKKEIESKATTSTIRDMTGSSEKIIETAMIHQQMEFKKLMELRYNIQMLAETCKQRMLQFHGRIKQEKSLQSQRAITLQELSKAVDIHRNSIKEHQEVHAWCSNFLLLCTEMRKSLKTVGISKVLDFLETVPAYTEGEFPLDALIGTALEPLMASLVLDWNPFTDPQYLFQDWKRIRAVMNQETNSEIMIPFERLVYMYWLPKVRQSIKYLFFNVSNQWNVEEPDLLISFIEIWKDSNIIVPWLFSNMVHQLILPKLRMHLEEWNFNKFGFDIHYWLFPWMPLLGTTLEPVWAMVKNAFSVHLRNWKPDDPMYIQLIKRWSVVFTLPDFESLLVKIILPGLIQYAHTNFEINPQNQNIQPLLHIFEWKDIIPRSHFALFLETEFFKPWHEILWYWLSSDQVDLEQVTEWYSSWKLLFDQHDLLSIETVKRGFRIGLDMMNQGSLENKPEKFIPTKPQSSKTPTAQQIEVPELTFRDYIDQLCSESNVEFVPLFRRNKDGKELYRIGSLHCYVEDGILFIQQGDRYQFTSIEDAIELAKK